MPPSIRFRMLLVSCAVLALSSCLSTRPHFDARSFTVQVDGSADLAALLTAGSYGWVYSEVNAANFPPTASSGSRELSITLVKLDQYSSIEKVVATQKEEGRRPADLRELLAFGAAYPDVQKQASIVAFGSHRAYTTVEYDRFPGMDPAQMKVEENLVVQEFYPTLTNGLRGRSVLLIQEDMIPAFDLGGFYACFVQEGHDATG